MRRGIVAVVACLLATAACGEREKDMNGRDIETVAAEARSYIDQLATAVGTDPEVQQDAITDCVPGQKESGKDLIYNVRVRVEPGALQRVLDDVAPDFEARGWDVRQRGEDEVVFRKDNITMGATIFPDHGLAAVSGSGGCVK